MDAISLADRYYAAFRNKTDFSEVPLAEQLHFQGPSGTIEGAAPFRGVVSGLAQTVKGLEVRHQAVADGTVVTVYDFDLGLPDGPIPMAEVLRVEGDAIRAIELVFDTKRMPG
jgi:hypothetical protein